MTKVHLITSAALAVALAGAGCKGKATAEQAKAPPPPPVAVPLTAVAELPTPDTITLTGMVVADETSSVASDVAGKVVAVLVDDGDRVGKGAPLLRLDTRNAALNAREVKANVEAAKIQQKLADEECERAEALLAKGAITQAEAQRTRASCTAAAQQVAAVSARAQLVGQQISDGVVRAPFAGVVTRKVIAPGEWVAPGVPLLTLVDDDPLLVKLSVPELAAPKVKMDQEVAISTVALPEQTFRAKVTKVGTEVGMQSRALDVEATLDPGSPLKPGMFATGALEVGKTARPAVPRSAVRRRDQTWRVFVLVGDTLHERVVQLGNEPAPGMVSIQRGVAAGERVVTDASAPQIVDGLAVIP
ncbi:MAG: efflux RND transporter periplasmic adaptor subunit [Kofleriaceae bacterium]